MTLQRGPFYDADDVDDDEFLCALGAAIKASEPASPRFSPEAIKRLVTSYKTLQRCLTGEDLKVSWDMGGFFRDSGSVTAVGRRIVCKDTRALHRAFRSSSSMEICPMTDGTVSIALSFHGLIDRSKKEVYE